MVAIQPNQQGKVDQAKKRLKKHQAWLNNQWDDATNVQRFAYQKRLNKTLIHLAMLQSGNIEDVD